MTRAGLRFLRSLRARLLLALLLPLLVLAGLGAWLDYRTARTLAIGSHDRALAGIALGLAARLETDRDNDVADHLLAVMRTMGRFNPRDRLFHLVIDDRGRVLSGDAVLQPLAGPGWSQEPAFVDLSREGEDLRAVVLGYEGRDGRATIVVAETLLQRRADVNAALLAAAATNVAVAVCTVLLALLAVGVALRPLRAIGSGLDRQDVLDLRAIRLGRVPVEVAPLVRAINRLVRRLRRAVKAREAFIDNTAHQLRTPLAGLVAQLDLLQVEELPPAQGERVRQMAHSVRRLSRLVQQLLSLARSEGDLARTLPTGPVELPLVLEEVASACLDAALGRGIDLGFEPRPAVVRGSDWMLREAVVNLVGNAIAHTPAGTVVTVRCGTTGDRGPAFVEVEDDGPGIAPQDRDRVFQRFVRLADHDRQGTGLGLAIVREVAHRHGAQVLLTDGPGGRGLRVRIEFPDRDFDR